MAGSSIMSYCVFISRYPALSQIHCSLRPKIQLALYGQRLERSVWTFRHCCRYVALGSFSVKKILTVLCDQSVLHVKSSFVLYSSFGRNSPEFGLKDCWELNWSLLYCSQWSLRLDQNKAPVYHSADKLCQNSWAGLKVQLASERLSIFCFL